MVEWGRRLLEREIPLAQADESLPRESVFEIGSDFCRGSGLRGDLERALCTVCVSLNQPISDRYSIC